MNQTENPLDQLRDIHLPDQIDSFQLAPGWWFLLFLFLCFIGWSAIKFYRKQKSLALLKPLKAEIEILKKNEPDANQLSSLSALIKRVALIYYPNIEVSSLSGNDWINYINELQPDNAFSEEQRVLLVESIYQKSPKIESGQWQSLVTHTHKLLEEIIRKKASSNQGGKQ